LNLAFCLFQFYPFGGLERDFLRIARECQARGHSITVFTMRWDGPAPAGFDIRLLPPRGWTNHARAAAFSTAISSQVNSSKFDLVVGFNKIAGLDFYFMGDPCYAARLEERPRWRRWTARARTYLRLEASVFSPMSQTEILLLVEAEKAKVISHYATPDERFHLVPAGISRPGCAPEDAAKLRTELRREFGIPPGDHLLLMVGSDFRRKGVDRSIRALAALPEEIRRDSHLFVIGRGTTQPFIRLARRLGVAERVSFLGPREDVPRFLAGADLLLHPAYQETAGMVLIEALAAGLPVLASDHCGYAFHVQRSGAGELIPSPFDQSRMNRLLARSLSRQPAKQWRANALAYAATTDFFSLPQKAADLFEAAMKKKKLATVRAGVSNSGDDLIQCAGGLMLTRELAAHFDGPDAFERMLQLEGKAYRAVARRRTIEVLLSGRSYFVKIHFGVGWREILKNLLFLKRPVLGARNEYEALRRLEEIGVPTLRIAGFGERGRNPAGRESFLITEKLEGTVNLEEFCRAWNERPPPFRMKRRLIARVAGIARRLHRSGMNHRDFYLCHFHLRGDPRVNPPGSIPSPANDDGFDLFLIDLHRAQLRDRTPPRWLMKDLAGLLFSSFDIGLTRNDLFRFMECYRSKPLREILRSESRFWTATVRRAIALYKKIHGHPPRLPGM